VDLLDVLERRRGNPAASQAHAEAAGCLGTWSVVGPLGAYPMLDFDRNLPPEQAGPLAESYAADPWRAPPRPRRTVEAQGCAVHLGGLDPQGGAFYAETEIVFPADGERQLWIESPNPVALWIDDREVFRADRRKERGPRGHILPLALSPGTHRVLVKVSSRHPNPVLSVAQGSARPRALDLPQGTSPQESYLRRVVHLGRGDTTGALAEGRTFGKDTPVPVLWQLVRATMADPFIDSNTRRNTIRRLLTRAEEKDRHAWKIALVLAAIDKDEDKLQVAIKRLLEAGSRWPVVEYPLALAELYREKGWQGKADAAIRRALALDPTSCAVIAAKVDMTRRRRAFADLRPWAEKLVTCSADSRALMDVFSRAREWDKAEAEARRLARVRADTRTDQLTADLLRIERGRSGARTAELGKDLLGPATPGAQTLVEAVDGLLAAGRDDEATATLESVVSEHPSLLGSTAVLQEVLVGKHPLSEVRLPGSRVIREFERSGRSYDQPQIMVLDYTVMRVFQDGSALELTHNIWRAQSKEGVDALGEYHVREGATLLTLRTHKADGTILEPERIAGKESISLPRLQPGDYVEAEYLRPIPPNQSFPGGFQSWRFFFQSMEEAFDRSEFAVMAPVDMDLVVDPRGHPPTQEETVSGGLRTLRWVARESRPLVPEPSSVPTQEVASSVRVGIGTTWSAWIDRARDVLADRDPVDPVAQARVTKILGGVTDPVSKARRLFRWTVDNVEHSSEVFGSAPVMLASRRGDRVRVLHYLLTLAGVDSELLLARSFSSDHSPSSMPEGSEYRHLLVRLRNHSEVVLFLGQEALPFGYLPPVLRGEEAFVFAEGAPRVVLPEGLVKDRREMSVTVRLQQNGDAEFDIVETHAGTTAIRWRTDLQAVPASLLESKFAEAYVARLVSGALLTELQIENLDQETEPLVFRYGFRVEGFARKREDTLRVPAILPTRLAPLYARVGERTTPLLVSFPQDLDVTIRLQPPESMSFVDLPQSASLDYRNRARFELTVDRDGDSVVIHREVKLPLLRVGTEAYGEFAAFCFEADGLEAREIIVRKHDP
ncbi:MAG: hypothetical protein KC416_01430, partial [Myxococcales bacterium]|nr:hypothetical protein [Myxococcales bacterium]